MTTGSAHGDPLEQRTSLSVACDNCHRGVWVDLDRIRIVETYDGMTWRFRCSDCRTWRTKHLCPQWSRVLMSYGVEVRRLPTDLDRELQDLGDVT